MATHSSTLSWKPHGRRSMVGYSPSGCKESDTTEWLHFHKNSYFRINSLTTLKNFCIKFLYENFCMKRHLWYLQTLFRHIWEVLDKVILVCKITTSIARWLLTKEALKFLVYSQTTIWKDVVYLYQPLCISESFPTVLLHHSWPWEQGQLLLDPCHTYASLMLNFLYFFFIRSSISGGVAEGGFNDKFQLLYPTYREK